ncbi:MAG: hypothetical protein JWM19_4454 [Actinomycetia bacterium]|nr:hypothetical protein [Actinomycetes bacterium]
MPLRGQRVTGVCVSSHAAIITGRPLATPSEDLHLRAGVTHMAPRTAAVRQRLVTMSSTWAWLPGLQSGQHTLTAADSLLPDLRDALTPIK